MIEPPNPTTWHLLPPPFINDKVCERADKEEQEEYGSPPLLLQ